MQTWTNRINPPPATPWKLRAINKACIVLAVAQTVDATKNMASTTKMMSLRPHISDNLDQIGPDAAFPTRYAPPIQT